MDAPRRRFDPLALAVNGVAAAALLVVGGYVGYRIWRDPPQIARPALKPLAKPAPVAKQAPTPAPRTPTVVAGGLPAAPAALIAQHGGGRGWRYRVEVDPPLWRDATLSYRVRDRGSEKLVDTDFRYAGGQMQFHLGTFAAGHASHAGTRFPGFFMYAAYLDRPLNIGERFTWEWPWQLANGQVRPGRVKRYAAEVKEWGNLAAPPSVRAPNDSFAVARIEVRLSYVEDGVERAAVNETVWYAWRYLQIVRIVRDGKTPDEASHRIVAELMEHTYP